MSWDSMCICPYHTTIMVGKKYLLVANIGWSDLKLTFRRYLVDSPPAAAGRSWIVASFAA